MTSENSNQNVVQISDQTRVNSESPQNTNQPADSENTVCSKCYGTGTWLNPDVGPVLCDCRRSTPETRMEAARIPERFRKCSLHNYKRFNDSQHAAHRFACTLVENFPGVERGLLIMGGVGVGKTHLAIAIMRALIEVKGVPCLFYESGSLLKTIQESYSSISRTSEMRVLAPVFEAKVLVLDELGAAVPTDWVRDTMYQIINKRYNDRKLTIFTTNFPEEVRIERSEVEASAYLEDFTDAAIVKSGYKPGNTIVSRPERIKNTSLEERIGTRLRSRLFEMCKKVVIEGEDYRRHLDQQGFDPATVLAEHLRG